MKKSQGRYSSFVNELFNKYINELQILKQVINSDFDKLINEILSTEGKIIFSSIGKSFFISQKIASSMSSLGKPSIAIHATELLHGDLGFISKGDLLILMSHSGESEEIIKLSTVSKSLGIKAISITGNINSTLSKYSSHNFSYPSVKEVSLNGLAPTTSSTTMLILGDLIAITIENITNFNVRDYSKIHPLGAIGKSNSSLVSEFMTPSDKIPIVFPDSTVTSCLNIISDFKMGIVFIVNKKKKLIGLITDGDIRRFLLSNSFSNTIQINNIINRKFKYVRSDQTLLEANLIMISENKFVSVLPILDNKGVLVGSINTSTFLDNGIKFIRK